LGTGYETPLRPGDKDMPHLVFDDLDSGNPLAAARARDVVRAILERKYEDVCPPEYIERVVDSIVEDPVRVRPRRHTRTTDKSPVITGEALVALVVNDAHDIHHVRERGYVESPVRIRSILNGIESTGLFWQQSPRTYPERHIRAIHDLSLVRFLKKVCEGLPEGKSVYPYVFPLRNHARLPKDLSYCAGYYCIDTFTPLNKNAYLAAKRAVDCAMTGADFLLEGHPMAYALVRPPGHHAERSVFGGFCYFNNAAIAAEHLSQVGRVAILDIDYHHGNGQQDIFFRRSDVLTVSIHGHPRFAYPFFSGFKEEIGEGEGVGFKLNIPLAEEVDGPRHRKALAAALARIQDFGPRFHVICLGLDTAQQDPTGTWSLGTGDFAENGRMIGALDLPTLVVQEGGYRNVSLGANVRAFFTGLARAHPGVGT
jgi:acetoin utilization deacetylase AcuC-like enzyme